MANIGTQIYRATYRDPWLRTIYLALSGLSLPAVMLIPELPAHSPRETWLFRIAIPLVLGAAQWASLRETNQRPLVTALSFALPTPILAVGLHAKSPEFITPAFIIGIVATVAAVAAAAWLARRWPKPPASVPSFAADPTCTVCGGSGVFASSDHPCPVCVADPPDLRPR